MTSLYFFWSPVDLIVDIGGGHTVGVVCGCMCGCGCVCVSVQSLACLLRYCHLAPVFCHIASKYNLEQATR